MMYIVKTNLFKLYKFNQPVNRFIQLLECFPKEQKLKKSTMTGDL